MATVEFAVPFYPQEFFKLDTERKKSCLKMRQRIPPALFHKHRHKKAAKNSKSAVDINEMASHGHEARKIKEKFNEKAIWSDWQVIQLPFPVRAVFNWEINYFPFRNKDLEEDEVISNLPGGNQLITGVITVRLLAAERAPIKQRRGRMSTNIVDIYSESEGEEKDNENKDEDKMDDVPSLTSHVVGSGQSKKRGIILSLVYCYYSLGIAFFVFVGGTDWDHLF